MYVNYAQFGPLSAWWHGSTLLMHLGVTALVYLLAARICRDRTTALIAAAVFGVHPVHIESVAWITERREVDLLAAFEMAVREERVREVLDGFLPAHPGYDRLREALASYRRLAVAGGWRPILDGAPPTSSSTRTRRTASWTT